MEELSGKTAVVTGAASGIGFALAERCASEGMKVVLADVEQGALDEAARTLDGGAEVLAVRADVSRWEDVEALAGRAFEAFGSVHLLCNNAGVARTGGGGPGLWNRSLDDWRWLLGVNLWGVIHGVQAFLPRVMAQDEESHIVNTASVAGLLHANDIYGVTKHAVVALSEALYQQLVLARSRVGVSVLCPGWVRTNLLNAERNRPVELGGESAPSTEEARLRAWSARERMEGGMPPSEVAAAAIDGVRAGRFYIVPAQPEIKSAVRQYAEHIANEENPSPTPRA